MNPVNPADWTNTTKAQVIALINALLGVAVLFGLNLTTDQISAVMTAVNVAASLFVTVTYKRSPTRIPD